MAQSLSLTRSQRPSVPTWAMPTAACSNVARLDFLALAQGPVGARPGQRVREDLRDQLQPLDQGVRPVALRPDRVEGEGAHGGLGPDEERQHQGGLDAEKAGVVPIDGGLSRQVLHRGKGHHAPRQQLPPDPGELLLSQRPCSRQAFQGVVRVGGCEDTRGRARPLPEHGEIDAERLAGPAQRVFDLAVHLVGSQVDEPGGEIGEQRVELQAPLEAVA